MKTTTDKAIYINTPDAAAPALEQYHRLYIGSEFCSRRLPIPNEIDRTASLCKDRGAFVTFVTPVTPQSALGKVRSLIDHTAGIDVIDEIVVGDWGVLQYIHNTHKGRFKISLGRILAKQRSGPRIELLKSASPSQYESSKRCHLDVPEFIEDMKSLGVERFEMDYPIQGIDRAFLSALSQKIKLTLWRPFVYVSCTLRCPVDAAGGCPCIDVCYKMKSKHFPVPLLSRGNAVFYRNDDVPFDDMGDFFDRIVYQPDVP